MKCLKKMLLVNWYFFRREVIEFDKLTFLTGKNATGKSTIIDALQMLLLADTGGTFFNKSANGKSRRTLSGYLRGELTDDGSSGFTYLRNDPFTSYVVLEFYDEEKGRPFTAGCCFDFYSDADIQHVFFGYYGAIPQNQYIEKNLPLDIEHLRRWLNMEHPESTKMISATNKEFRDYLYGKLGGLQVKFADLFKKAVPFNPIADIQSFITEFVFGNEQCMDIPGMQETIRSYTEMEREAEQLKQRKKELEDISTLYADYSRYAGQVTVNQYIVDRACYDKVAEEKESQQKNLVHLQESLKTLEAELPQYRRKQDAQSTELVRVRSELGASGLQQQIERLEQQVEESNRKIRQWSDRYSKWDGAAQRLVGNWNGIRRGYLHALDGQPDDLVSERVSVRMETVQAHLKTAGQGLVPLRECPLCDLPLETLAGADSLCEGMVQSGNSLCEALKEEQHDTGEKLKVLLAEQRELQAGRQQYPRAVNELRTAVESRLQAAYGPKAHIRLVAELWDVKDPVWRNAVEGYLNTQRCNFIVPADWYQEAAAIYDEVKDRLNIHGVALVDIAAVQKAMPACRPGSLAEEILTNDKEARLYANFLLGKVMKCHKIEEHNRQEISITPGGMLYQQKAIRHLNPKIWEHPLLGQGGRALRLEQIEQELPPLRKCLEQLARLQNLLKDIPRRLPLGTSDLEECRSAVEGYRKIPAEQKQLAETQKFLAELDRAPLLALQDREKYLNDQITELTGQIEGLNKKIGGTEKEIETLETEIIPASQHRHDELCAALGLAYPAAWREETGEPRYAQEKASHADLDTVIVNFNRSRMAAETQRDDRRKELRKARDGYNRDWHTGYDTDREDNQDFDTVLKELSENKLPAYLSKIQDAKEKAVEQFQEEFIGVLHDNIRNALNAIEKLNRALKNPFSEDTYAFKVEPNPDYRRYYDMITDPMKMENYSLFSETFNKKYRQEIDELFQMLTDTRTEDEDKRIAKYTNYRTYLNFDLTVTSPDGAVQRLSKTMDKKSGGETQTPFYIAVLASFAQIYRMDRDRHGSTIRLIVFDEAFSKMDGDRIEQSIKILRDFDFQVILSAPTDKIGDIATLVDRNLCVMRKGHSTVVRAFDPRETVYETV